MEEEIIPVVFRIWRGDDWKGENGSDCLALFPTEPATDGYDIVCYAHVGGHASAHWNVCIAKTRPAKPEEYADLKKELEDIGYRLKVYARGAHLLHYRTRRIR